MLAMAGVAVYVAGAIYDTGTDQRVTPYFFQPNNLSERRPGIPQTPTDMGSGRFLDLLVRKYITEYFYATPDPENIAQRTGPNSVMARMSSANVFDTWRTGEATTIQKLAEDKSLRIVYVIDQIYQPRNSMYWVVNYELHTWRTPNDFSVVPEITRGTLYMDILYNPEMRPVHNIQEIHNYLENGGDPATVFQFRVNSIIQG